MTLFWKKNEEDAVLLICLFYSNVTVLWEGIIGFRERGIIGLRERIIGTRMLMRKCTRTNANN